MVARQLLKPVDHHRGLLEEIKLNSILFLNMLGRNFGQKMQQTLSVFWDRELSQNLKSVFFFSKKLWIEERNLMPNDTFEVFQ